MAEYHTEFRENSILNEKGLELLDRGNCFNYNYKFTCQSKTLERTFTFLTGEKDVSYNEEAEVKKVYVFEEKIEEFPSLKSIGIGKRGVVFNFWKPDFGNKHEFEYYLTKEEKEEYDRKIDEADDRKAKEMYAACDVDEIIEKGKKPTKEEEKKVDQIAMKYLKEREKIERKYFGMVAPSRITRLQLKTEYDELKIEHEDFFKECDKIVEGLIEKRVEEIGKERAEACAA